MSAALYPIVLFIVGLAVAAGLLSAAARIIGYGYTKGVQRARADERRRYNLPTPRQPANPRDLGTSPPAPRPLWSDIPTQPMRSGER